MRMPMKKRRKPRLSYSSPRRPLENGPKRITSGLFGVIQSDPLTDLNSITLRVTYRLNPLEKIYEPGWAFTDINGDALAASGAKRAANTQQFFKYVPVFFLSALRDASEESHRVRNSGAAF